MRVSAPTDKRFRRPSIRPAQRQRLARVFRARPVRRVATAALAIAVLYAGVAAVAASGVFRVNRVTVRGNARLSTGEVLALVSELKGESVITANLPRYRDQLVDSPWVADATLRRVLPGSVEITIREREPMGLCRLQDRLYLVDDTGTIIDEFGPQHADLNLPIIDGLSGPPLEGAPSIDPARAELAARVMRAISTHRVLARRVSQIDVRNPRNAVVILDGETALLHLGDSQFVERLQSYLDLAPTLHARVPDIDYVDLRFDQRVYVRPAKTARRGQGPEVR